MAKYMEIAKEIEEAIREGKYPPNSRLPSLTALAKQYACSKGTIIQAYAQLQKAHLIYVKAQSGYYVASNNMPFFQESEQIRLDTGNPAVSLTSLYDAKHCMSLAIEHYSESSLDVSIEGVYSLRQLLPGFLAESGIYARLEDIYLVQGITQMLSFLSETTFPNQGEYILIEEPTYSYYVQFLKEQGLPVLTITRDALGIDLKELEHLMQAYPIKFFYTIPRAHNPLGTTLSSKTRKKIAELAVRYQVYIIEDDYFASCAQSKRYLPIYYYAQGKYCIYLTSFTKIIPYIRIGICVIHPEFQKIYQQLVAQSYYFSYQHPSLISQATLESYLRSQLYHKQVESITQHFKPYYAMLKKVSASWDPHLARMTGDFNCYYVSVLLHPGISISRLEKRLLQHHIRIARNERCFYDLSHFNHSLRIGIARVRLEDLQMALERFYAIVENEYAHHLSKKAANKAA